MNKTRYLVSQTYSDYNLASMEHGDPTDSGFIFQDRGYTLKELISFIHDEYGHYFENFNENKRGQDLYGELFTLDYNEGIERSTAVHIVPISDPETKAGSRAVRHLNRALRRMLK